jgi:hypothetical protein
VDAGLSLGVLFWCRGAVEARRNCHRSRNGGRTQDLRNGSSQVMQNNLPSFAEGIAKLGLTETGLAIALLWYFDQSEGRSELRPAYLAELMHDLSLRRRVNVTRLGRQLLANRDVMRGREMGTVRLRVAGKSRLSSRYNEIAGIAAAPATDAQIIPAGLFENTRPHLESLVTQINGTYQHGFYDSCAVMCRRLLECLVLLAFERAEKGDVIRDAAGEYRAFADIIGLACSNRHIKLTRGAGTVMGKIEYVGGLAIRHPTYITRQKDIDEQRPGFRRVISELADLAEIQPKGSARPSPGAQAAMCP